MVYSRTEMFWVRIYRYLVVLESDVLFHLIGQQLNRLVGLAKILVNPTTTTALFTVPFLLTILLLLDIVLISLPVSHDINLNQSMKRLQYKRIQTENINC